MRALGLVAAAAVAAGGRAEEGEGRTEGREGRVEGGEARMGRPEACRRLGPIATPTPARCGGGR